MHTDHLIIRIAVCLVVAVPAALVYTYFRTRDSAITAVAMGDDNHWFTRLCRFLVGRK